MIFLVENRCNSQLQVKVMIKPIIEYCQSHAVRLFGMKTHPIHHMGRAGLPSVRVRGEVLLGRSRRGNRQSPPTCETWSNSSHRLIARPVAHLPCLHKECGKPDRRETWLFPQPQGHHWVLNLRMSVSRRIGRECHRLAFLSVNKKPPRTTTAITMGAMAIAFPHPWASDEERPRVRRTIDNVPKQAPAISMLG